MSFSPPPSTIQTFLSGVNGAVGIAPPGSSTSSFFTVTKGNFTHTIDTDDITNSFSPNWRSKLPSINEITGTITFTFDILNSPFNPVYALKVGNTITLSLTADYQAGSQLPVGGTFGTKTWAGAAIVKSFKPSGVGPQAGGAFMVDVDFESTGTWTTPTT